MATAADNQRDFSSAAGSGADIEAILERFETAWQCGKRPPIEEFLPERSGQHQLVLRELIHVDLEWRIKSGENRRVEDYLAQFPELAAEQQQVVPSLIRAEYRIRRRREPALAASEYRRRFPEFAIDLTDLGICMEPDQQATACAEQTPQSPNDSGVVTDVCLASAPLTGSRAFEHYSPPTYECLGELGRGGMGIVFKARQIQLNRIVALKMILAGEMAGHEHRRRFQSEAEAVAKLIHPNIVQIYEVGEYQGRPYFSLEYVSGPSLAEHLAGQPQPEVESARLLETLARAVETAHARGIVHRDLKPANVLLTPDGIPKITDFGLAKQLDTTGDQTETGMVMGSPSYMSPEQASGNVRAIGPATDVYALGAILYEMLTGRAPFRGESVSDTLNQVLSQEPVPPRQLRARLARDIETICLKCLEKDPSRRFGSAGAVADDLRRFLEGRPIIARPVSHVERAWRWIRRYPAVAGLSTAVLLTAVVAFVLVSAQLFLRVEAQKRWVSAQVDALTEASEDSIPFLLASLNEFPEYAAERLRLLHDSPDLSPAQRIRVTLALLETDPSVADEVAELLLKATPGEVRVICAELSRLGIRPMLIEQVIRQPPLATDAPENEHDALAKQKANAALALAQLGKIEQVWPMLRESPDNSIRSHLINDWAASGIAAELLVDRLKQRQVSVDEQRALYLALGSVPVELLPAEKRERILAELDLIGQFERNPDPGLHAAVRWLLCQWGKRDEVRRLELQLAERPRGNTQWYVNSELQTMTVLGPATFLMGSPESEQERDPNAERLHECQIPRRFSIAQQEVTIEQYEKFGKQNPVGGPDAVEPDCPARNILWPQAAAYCNSLSKRAGIDRDQWCYEAEMLGKIMHFRPAENYLQRTGYRLPTEAEWEYACRAGTSTPRFFGYSIELLPQYAQCPMRDPSGRKGAVGMLLPNDFGLFDMYGNAHEWCNDNFAPYPAKATIDRGGQAFSSKQSIILRGLASGDLAIPRSALRDRGESPNPDEDKVEVPAIGFRVARTESSDEQ